MSDDLAEFTAHGRPCVVARLLSDMTDELRSVVIQALAGDEHRYASNRISSVLARKGVFVSRSSVVAHRRNLCSCARL